MIDNFISNSIIKFKCRVVEFYFLIQINPRLEKSLSIEQCPVRREALFTNSVFPTAFFALFFEVRNEGIPSGSLFTRRHPWFSVA